jgi:Flp pilus assembly protein TadD
LKLPIPLTRYVGSRKALLLAVLCLRAVPSLGALCHGSPALEAKVRTQPSAKAYAALGTWFRERRQFECAAEAFAQALKLKPDSASLAYLQGASLYSAGNAKEAIVSLQRSVRLDSKVLQPHLLLGAAFDGVHDMTNAELEWRAALALDPKSATARNALSKDLLAEKDYGSGAGIWPDGKASGRQ